MVFGFVQKVVSQLVSHTHTIMNELISNACNMLKRLKSKPSLSWSTQCVISRYYRGARSECFIISPPGSFRSTLFHAIMPYYVHYSLCICHIPNNVPCYVVWQYHSIPQDCKDYHEIPPHITSCNILTDVIHYI